MGSANPCDLSANWSSFELAVRDSQFDANWHRSCDNRDANRMRDNSHRINDRKGLTPCQPRCQPRCQPKPPPRKSFENSAPSAPKTPPGSQPNVIAVADVAAAAVAGRSHARRSANPKPPSGDQATHSATRIADQRNACHVHHPKIDEGHSRNRSSANRHRQQERCGTSSLLPMLPLRPVVVQSVGWDSVPTLLWMESQATR